MTEEITDRGLHITNYCLLNDPIKVGRSAYLYVALDYIEHHPDYKCSETLAVPARRKRNGVLEIAKWNEIKAWRNEEPDFDRYACELNATIVD